MGNASYLYTGMYVDWLNQELIFIVILGIICGVIGANFVKLTRFVHMEVRRKYFTGWNWTYTFIVSVIVLNLTFLIEIDQTSDSQIITSMTDIDKTIAEHEFMSPEDMHDFLNTNYTFSKQLMLDVNNWVLYDGYLALYLVQKIFLTAFSLSCPLPGGIYTPAIAIGSVIGQLYVS